MITREQAITQSVEDFLRDKLTEHGYMDVVELRDAFPTPDERAQAMTHNIMACAYNFDDGGRMIEMGSDLTQRVYTIEFWVFGVDYSAASNIATVVRTFIEDEGYLIPLKDIGNDGAAIDSLTVRDGSYGANQGPIVTHQIPNDPRPGDRYVFTCIIRVEDVYYPSLVD